MEDTNGNDDYVEESHCSDDDRSSDGRSREQRNDNYADDSSECSDRASDELFFTSRSYSCREDVVAAVVDYHVAHGRAFKIVSSDFRRYKAVCTDPTCTFVANFAYGKAFGPPTAFMPHSCDPTKVDLSPHEAGRSLKPTYLAHDADVRQFVIDNGRSASPIELQHHLARDGRRVSYRSCVDVCNGLKASMFASDRSQYQLILSYVHELNKRGHKADIDLRANVISRVVVVFRQGIHAASVFADRGLCLDGTFMKQELGGTLLVACLRNSNNEIQIVSIAWVTSETKNNWSWFVNFLLQSVRAPAFVMSDRDKGLKPAMEVEAPVIPHFVCLRHLMENFNAKFKNKALRDDAWKLGKSLSVASYARRATQLQLKNAKALEWLEAADKLKWSAAHSSCPRFGTMTSNNVESTNGVLLKAREMPLLHCLLHIEKYVGERWVAFVGKTASWGVFTPFAQKKFVRATDKVQLFPSCATAFVARVATDGQLPVDYAIDLDNRERPCSCGISAYMKAPCTHIVAALKYNNALSSLNQYFDESWTTETYRRAYDPALKMRPFVLKEELMRFESHQPPPVPKKRGRPKKSKKRIESQQASLSLNKKSVYTCTACKEKGHNKRSCKNK